MKSNAARRIKILVMDEKLTRMDLSCGKIDDDTNSIHPVMSKLEHDTLMKLHISSEEDETNFNENIKKRKIPKNPNAVNNNTELLGPRWKGKNFSDFARENPMSKIISQLQDSFKHETLTGHLSGFNVILPIRSNLSNLLDRASLGRQISTSDQDLTWFQLGPEEAFYLVHSLGCLKILDSTGQIMDNEFLWKYMNDRKVEFHNLYIAYDHLRSKNWVVRPGIQYGVDFVVYRHHPALVHSEYAVIVLGDNGLRARLREWADIQGTLRVCGSVAKNLLVITVKRNFSIDEEFPLCIEKCFVEERVMARWIPQQNRDGTL